MFVLVYPIFRHTQMNGYRSKSDSCLMLATGMRLSIAARTITEWADDHQKNEDLSKNRPNIGNLLRHDVDLEWFRMIEIWCLQTGFPNTCGHLRIPIFQAGGADFSTRRRFQRGEFRQHVDDLEPCEERHLSSGCISLLLVDGVLPSNSLWSCQQFANLREWPSRNNGFSH